MLDNLYRNLELKNKQLVANVLDYKVLPAAKKNVFAKATFNLSNNNSSLPEIEKAINVCLEGKARGIPGSFRCIDQYRKSDNELLIGFVKANLLIKADTEENRIGTVALASNVLMDNTDKTLWRIQKTGNSSFLCRDSEEDISELLSNITDKRMLKPGTSLQELSVTASPGDYILFADPYLDTSRFGHVLSTEEGRVNVIPLKQNHVYPNITIGSYSVIHATDIGLDIEDLLSGDNTGDITSIIEYYRTLYRQDPDYYRVLEKSINEFAVI